MSLNKGPKLKNWTKMQEELSTWERLNFDVPKDVEKRELRMLAGVTEELGELSHAILKRQQGIRGTAEQHHAAALDAIGDITIFLMQMCSTWGVSFGDVVTGVAHNVMKRQWKPTNLEAQLRLIKRLQIAVLRHDAWDHSEVVKLLAEHNFLKTHHPLTDPDDVIAYGMAILDLEANLASVTPPKTSNSDLAALAERETNS